MMRLRRLARAIATDTSGLALIEFAFVLPVLTLLILYGVETANYMMAQQRVSQLALQVADNASRIGTQSVLRNRPITEAQINDLLVGAQLQAGSLDLAHKGRVILSGVTVNSSGGQWLQWQRCTGAPTFPSHYGAQNDGENGTSYPGIGPANARVLATTTAPVVFAEVAVDYTPVISRSWAPGTRFTEIAALAVRDDRDTTAPGVRNDEGAPVSGC